MPFTRRGDETLDDGPEGFAEAGTADPSAGAAAGKAAGALNHCGPAAICYIFLERTGNIVSMRQRSPLGRPASHRNAASPEFADSPRARGRRGGTGTVRRHGVLAALTVIVVLAAALTGARAGEYQRFQNQVWFGITPTWSSSHCIGRPVDPICAVETAIACLARANAALCRRVGVSDFPSPGSRPHSDRYRLLGIRWIDQDDVEGIYDTFRYRNPALWDRIPEQLQIRPGDVQIAVEKDPCAPEWSYRCIFFPSVIDYYVRRRGDDWYVITWGGRELKP